MTTLANAIMPPPPPQTTPTTTQKPTQPTTTKPVIHPTPQIVHTLSYARQRDFIISFINSYASLARTERTCERKRYECVVVCVDVVHDDDNDDAVAGSSNSPLTPHLLPKCIRVKAWIFSPKEFFETQFLFHCTKKTHHRFRCVSNDVSSGGGLLTRRVKVGGGREIAHARWRVMYF